MLTADCLLAWFQPLNLPEQARSTIRHIRSAGPARRVGGGKSNVPGRYPSRKMGPSSSRVIGSNWLAFTRWNTMLASSNISTSRPQSNSIMRVRPESGWVSSTLQISSSFAKKKPDGRSGKRRQTCSGLQRGIPIATAPAMAGAGNVLQVMPMRSVWGAITACDHRRRSTSCFNEISSSWRIIFDPTREKWPCQPRSCA